MVKRLAFWCGTVAASAAVAVLAAQSASTYRLVPNWGMLPAGTEWTEVPAVAVDASDTILVFRRGDAPIFEFDRAGKLLKQWGQGLFVWPHGIRVDRDGNVWVTDGRAQDGRGQ